MYVISKEFHFDYGHRVWSQELNEDYALTKKNKCRHLHGHSGKVIVHLSSDTLQNGMVTDFNNLGWLKQFIDDNIDHKFIIDKNDPLFCPMTGLQEDILEGVPEEIPDVFDALREYRESFYVIDFCPTSENLAKWMFEIIQEKMEPLGVRVSKVEWCETPKTKATYAG